MEGSVRLLVAFGVAIGVVFCLICLKWVRDGRLSVYWRKVAREDIPDSGENGVQIGIRIDPPPPPPSIPSDGDAKEPVLSVPHL